MIFTLERRQCPRNLPVGEVIYIDDFEVAFPETLPMPFDFADTLPMQPEATPAVPAIPGLDVIEIFEDEQK